jgi:hypothetical protein
MLDICLGDIIGLSTPEEGLLLSIVDPHGEWRGAATIRI